VDSRYYSHLEHGYATTVHEAQTTTVDRIFVLATPQLDRHTTYIALSRHRQAATLVYATEDFGAAPGIANMTSSEVREHFHAVLSRARPKELTHDFLDPTVLLDERPAYKKPHTLADIDLVQQKAAERWLAKQRARTSALSPDNDLTPSRSEEPDHGSAGSAEKSKSRHQSYQGPEDDLDV
jgi:hypothetical protein